MKALAATVMSLSLATAAIAQEDQPLKVTRSGSVPSAAGAPDNFTGNVRVDSPFRAEAPARVSGGLVTFEPGAHTAWHTHPLGQTLIVTSGVGLVQRWGGPVQEIRPGDVVWIPPATRHWHGATPTTGMSHYAIAEQLDGKSADWLEKLSGTQYPGSRVAQAAPAAAAPAASSVAPAPGTAAPAQTVAQRGFGDINPKLAELTDNVLFGDVWARPGLSQRDRSLVTVSALIALNRPDQLRSHLQRARDNGLTEAELIEAITQLAFYSGWPNAIIASNVAREVFRKKP